MIAAQTMAAISAPHFLWSGIPESNRCFDHGKVVGYHYTNSAMERMMGFEPTISTLARSRCTTQLHPHIFDTTHDYRSTISSPTPLSVETEELFCVFVWHSVSVHQDLYALLTVVDDVRAFVLLRSNSDDCIVESIEEDRFIVIDDFEDRLNLGSSIHNQSFLERVTGIEPVCLAWETSALPMCYTRYFLIKPGYRLTVSHPYHMWPSFGLEN